MRVIGIISLATVIIISSAWILHSYKTSKPATFHNYPVNATRSKTIAEYRLKKLQSKANEARSFIKDKGYNKKYCFMIDMSIMSGAKRFYVYNLAEDRIYKSGLVTHGRCNEYWLNGRKYDNTVGSGCTSLGKYKIGKAYHGRFGLAYKLHGLDASNNNAYKRYVVMHAHECVPEEEVVKEICQSDGCPTVSPGFLKELDIILKSSSKPILLWIYE
ncbi:MAG TPA: murein L,D-transpeptidase catalytic domain family protein [Chitinophagaceae bacterium]